MTWLALPWFVLRTTGSPQRMTWVIIAEIVPIARARLLGRRDRGARRHAADDADLRPRAGAAPRRDPAAARRSGSCRSPCCSRSSPRAASSSRRTWACSARSSRSSSARSRRRRDRDRVVPGREPADDPPRPAARRRPDRRHRRVERPLRRRGDATSSRSCCSSRRSCIRPRCPAQDGRARRARRRALPVQRPAAAGVDAGVHAARHLLDAPLRVAARARRDEVRRDPRILGWLFGALGGGALVGALVALRIVRRIDTADADGGGVPLPDGGDVGRRGSCARGACRSSRWPSAGSSCRSSTRRCTRLLMLRMPRHLRAQALAAFGVFSPSPRRSGS